MHIDLLVALGSLVVGFVVGLTGMGGGALMTPMLVLIFHTQPLTAASSDLVASFIMKPVGGGVHLRALRRIDEGASISSTPAPSTPNSGGMAALTSFNAPA